MASNIMDNKQQYEKYKNRYLDMKNQIQVHVSEPWFSLIKSGQKVVEGRLNKGLFSKIKINDTLVMFHMDKKTHKKTSFVCKVIDKKEYLTFESMIKDVGLEKILPGIKTLEEGVAVYRNFYSEELEKQYGVIAVFIKL
jgi:ASC-1-like (ASCH) protein